MATSDRFRGVWRAWRQASEAQPRPTRQVRLTFQLKVVVADEPDPQGLYSVEVHPLGIATFGTSSDDALLEAEDAITSYILALGDAGILRQEFQRLGVELEAVDVVTTGSAAPVIDIPVATPEVATGRTLLPA